MIKYFLIHLIKFKKVLKNIRQKNKKKVSEYHSVYDYYKDFFN